MSGFDIFMIVLACLLILVGFVGCIMPGLPGTPLCWGALLCRHFMNGGDVIISWKTLIITGVITIFVEILNNFVPAIFTKKAGGSKLGTWGATIGVIVGIITGQIWLIVFGSFIGAWIGEMLHDNSNGKRAIKSAGFSFLGFITGTGMRLIVSGIWISIFVKSFF